MTPPLLRFARPWKQFKAGQPVPDTLDPGIRATLLSRFVVEEVPVAVTVPPDDDSPTGFRPAVDKAVRTGSTRVKRK